MIGENQSPPSPHDQVAAELARRTRDMDLRRHHNRDDLHAQEAIIQAAERAIKQRPDDAAGIIGLLTELGIPTVHRAVIALTVEVPLGQSVTDMQFVRERLDEARYKANNNEADDTEPWIYTLDPGRNYPAGWSVGIVSPRIPQGGDEQ